MINRKKCQCYLCRGTIQVGQNKKRVHGTNYAHEGCNRAKRQRVGFLGFLFNKLSE